MSLFSNKVQLIGRLGNDVEMITFDDGKTKSRFPIACTETHEGKVTRTAWHDIVAWEDTAFECSKLSKGDTVCVEGRLNYRTYEDGDGVTRYITEIVIYDVMKFEDPKVEFLQGCFAEQDLEIRTLQAQNREKDEDIEALKEQIKDNNKLIDELREGINNMLEHFQSCDITGIKNL